MLRQQHASLLLCIAISFTGCAEQNTKPRLQSMKFARVKRTALEKSKLIDPGPLGRASSDARQAFFNRWNEQIVHEDTPVGTVFMGDSITEIWDLHVYFTPALGELIENRGISSDLASIMVKRFEADVVQLRPRNVVILAGTNDIGDMIRENKPDEEITAAVASYIESMVDAAQAADIKVLVGSILPTHDTFSRHEERPGLRAAINEKLKEICKAKSCIYVDYAAAMRDGQGNLRKDLSRDGLHPNWAGYTIMARVLKEAAKTNGIAL